MSVDHQRLRGCLIIIVNDRVVYFMIKVLFMRREITNLCLDSKCSDYHLTTKPKSNDASSG